MTKILIINPVSTPVWNDITAREVRKVINPSTEVVVRNLSDAPPAIECEYDKDIAAPHVIKEVIEAAGEGFNSIIINCFDDPGVKGAREVSDTLILGAGETSITVALTLGYRLAIISTGRYAKLAYYRRALELGIKDRVVYVAGIDTKVLSMSKDRGKIREMIKDEVDRAVSTYGADVIVLGCTGFVGLASELNEIVGVPVIDPTLVTVKIAEALSELHLKHSRNALLNRLEIPYEP